MIVGVICEYDPFHRGHKRQFELIRQSDPSAKIVCVMSGCFTQRGMPALFAPDFRARAALNAGADLVLELPCAFAVREAENFALGGVSLLNRLGFVTHLSFGCESSDVRALESAAELLEAPTDAFRNALQASLSDGKPFAAAQAEAVAAVIPDVAPTLSQPNNVLAVCYLRALRRLHSAIKPLPVLRQGDYRTDTLSPEAFPSASAVRSAYLQSRLTDCESACGYSLADAAAHRPEALDSALLYRLRGMSKEALRALPDCTEGLENRLFDCAQSTVDRDSLLALLKTRRYAYARLNRLATHAMLGIDRELLAKCPLPSYARLLGFRQNSRELLSLLRHSELPILAKAAAADRSDPLFQLDARAYDLWALGARLPAGLIYRQKIVIEE